MQPLACSHPPSSSLPDTKFSQSAFRGQAEDAAALPITSDEAVILPVRCPLPSPSKRNFDVLRREGIQNRSSGLPRSLSAGTGPCRHAPRMLFQSRQAIRLELTPSLPRPAHIPSPPNHLAALLEFVMRLQSQPQREQKKPAPAGRQ